MERAAEKRNGTVSEGPSVSTVRSGVTSRHGVQKQLRLSTMEDKTKRMGTKLDGRWRAR